ncbi:MAG TPA: hypothetical protein DIU15_05330, partial [Deltaproteobacteria bacterium]|nr:hypothetical protein [Deltaproteobacteria bacterium]
DDDDSGDDSPSARIAIGGQWSGPADGVHTVSSSSWSDPYGATFNLSQFQNAQQFAIAQNHADNDFNPGLWSRFDWTWDEFNTLWYCQTCYDCEDEGEALATDAADSSALSSDGCGGFAWSSLTPTAGSDTWELAISGVWADAWGGTHTIDNATWSDSYGSSFSVSQFHNNSQFLVAQNDPTNSFNAGQWSRFDWTWDESNTLWYCQTCFDCADEAAAVATAAASTADPATTGCGGFAWSSVTPSP